MGVCKRVYVCVCVCVGGGVGNFVVFGKKYPLGHLIIIRNLPIKQLLLVIKFE